MATTPPPIDLGRVGVWSPGLRFADPALAREHAAELEDLGYRALWIPGGAHPGTLAAASALLAATRSVSVASGIVNIWMEDASTIADQTHQLNVDYPGRFMLGVGVSHAPLIGDRYQRPLSAMRSYLEALDASEHPVPRDARIVAALGPKMLEIAREQSAGSHPYLTPPEHTRSARRALGPTALLAPEQTVVLDADPVSARTAARTFLSTYLGMPNYTNNLKRIASLKDSDFENGGSNRLVDTVIAWGTEDAIRNCVEAHLDAGADHVCVQVVAGWDELPREQLRRLADSLAPLNAASE